MKIEIHQEEPTFAMAPMIDMVFLLLIFFMCASHVSQQQALPMEIPEASKAVVPKERPERWIVNITADGVIHSGDQVVTVDQLAAAVKERLATQPGLKMYIRADADSPHKEVKKVMNGLAEVGMDDFIFGVYKPSTTAETGP